MSGGYAYSLNPQPQPRLTDPDDAGGGLTATNAAKITLNNCDFSANTAYRNGGGVYLSDPGSTLRVTHSLFTSNGQLCPYQDPVKQGQGGGGIAVLNDGYAQVSKSIFRGNTGEVGHTDDECDFGLPVAEMPDIAEAHKNIRGPDAGGMFIYNSSAKISQTLFTGNQALSGGGISVYAISETSAHSVTIEDSAFINNYAPHVGGAIEILGSFPTGSNPGSRVTITNTIFDSNESHIGGTVFADSYNVAIDKSIFRNNTTGGIGGALSSSNLLGTMIKQLFGTSVTVGHVAVTNTDFSGNTSTGDPTTAGHFDTIFVVGPSFRPDIQLTLGGAAISNFANGNLTVDRCTFENNQALNTTVLMCPNPITPLINNGGASLNGGANVGAILSDGADILPPGIGLDVAGGNLVVRKSEFNGNSTTGNGGAIVSVLNVPSGYTPITRPTIDVRSSRFKTNTASNGGAVYFDNTTPTTILRNTFVGTNHATSLGDQIYGTNSTVNGILTSNSAAVEHQLQSSNIFLNLVSDDFYFQ